MELLLLDNDSEVEQLVRDLYRARSLVCHSVSDIEAALEKLRAGAIDAVLVSASGSAVEPGAGASLARTCRAHGAALLLLLDDLAQLRQLDDDTRSAIDDFILPPHDAEHLDARLDLLTRRRRIYSLREEQSRATAQAKQAFAARVLGTLEAERHHLSRELHDSISQLLLVHRMDAEWVAREADTDPVRDAAERLCTGLDETLHLVRALAMELRPPAIDDLGLGSALETLCTDVSRRSGIRCEFLRDARMRTLPEETGVTIFRIAQEALANAMRHAKCRNIHVQLIEHSRSVELCVADDGVGIEPARLADAASFGLVGMRERAELVGGHVSIQTDPNHGTCIRAMVPYAPYRASAVNHQAPSREGKP